MYKKTTFGITITAEPYFAAEQSSAAHGHYVWGYNISIKNNSEKTVQLMDRHWRITDSFGNFEEVRGAGVIGKQPVLKPGEEHTYSSGTNLKTSSGIMHGTYKFKDLEKEEEYYEVEIPAFSLDSPYTEAKYC